MANEEARIRQISEGRLQEIYNGKVVSDKPVPPHWKESICGFAGVVNKGEMAALFELRHALLKQPIRNCVSVSTRQLPPIDGQE